jgi:hypothetical protein
MLRYALYRPAPADKPIDASAKTTRLAHARRVLAACERRLARAASPQMRAKSRITRIRFV